MTQLLLDSVFHMSATIAKKETGLFKTHATDTSQIHTALTSEVATGGHCHIPGKTLVFFPVLLGGIDSSRGMNGL